MVIVQWNVDDASYEGDGENGVYWLSAQGPDEKWYVTTVVDCEHFTDTMHRDAGPYDTKADADQAGRNAAIDWCLTNQVAYGEDTEE